MYASQEILLGSSSGGSSGQTTTAGEGSGDGASASPGAAAGEGAGASGDTSAKRTPAQRLLDEIMVTDADRWDGVLASLSAPGSMTGGVTKEGLLGAIQVRTRAVGK